MLFSHLARMDESADARILTAVPQSDWKSLAGQTTLEVIGSKHAEMVQMIINISQIYSYIKSQPSSNFPKITITKTHKIPQNVHQQKQAV